MELADNADFRQKLLTLSEVFDRKLSSFQVAIYFEALRDLPLEQVAQAMNRALQVCKFFPKPAELREFALGSVEDRAEVAWMAFRRAMHAAGAYTSLVVRDAALGEAIVRMFGSWPAACAAELSDEMWASRRKEFGRIYRVLAERRLEGGRYLAGICETANAGRADWAKYAPVSRLEGDAVTRLSLEEAEQARELMAVQASGFRQIASAIDIQPEARDDSA